MRLVDDVKTALTAHNAVIAVTRAQGLDRVLDFHFEAIRKTKGGASKQFPAETRPTKIRTMVYSAPIPPASPHKRAVGLVAKAGPVQKTIARASNL